jgi:hypothetical protein
MQGVQVSAWPAIAYLLNCSQEHTGCGPFQLAPKSTIHIFQKDVKLVSPPSS